MIIIAIRSDFADGKNRLRLGIPFIIQTIYIYIHETYILMTYILDSYYIPTTGTVHTRFEILLLLYIYTQCVNIIRYIGFFFFIGTTLLQTQLDNNRKHPTIQEHQYNNTSLFK